MDPIVVPFTYTLAPHYIGYSASLFDRNITVRLSHLSPTTTTTLAAVGVIEVQLDDPTDASLLVVSDLEPRTSYQQGNACA